MFFQQHWSDWADAESKTDDTGKSDVTELGAITQTTFSLATKFFYLVHGEFCWPSQALPTITSLLQSYPDSFRKKIPVLNY